MPRRLKVLISGGGIAGISLAFWLSKLNHDVTIVERFPELRVNGLQVDLRGNGIEVMKRMGLDAAFRARAAPETGLEFVDTTGKRWAYFGANKTGKGSQAFTSDYEIMRGDMCRIMYEPTKDKVKYIFGATIESFEDQGSSVEVKLTNGQTGNFDLVVGADGVMSRTRRMILDPNHADPFHPVNECIAYFTVPRPIKPGEEYVATVYVGPRGQMMMTRRHDPNILQVYLLGGRVREKLESVRRNDVEGEKAIFIKTFRGAGWQVDEILDMLKDNEDFYCERQGIIKLDSWSQGRVVLLGDAAYCPTAGPGAGTSCAIMGAYILAGEIEKHCYRGHPGVVKGEGEDELKQGLMSALKSYEDLFRPFMTQTQKGMDDPGLMEKVPWNHFTVYMFYWLVWFASLMRLDLIATRLLSDKTKDWKLPEYKELVA